MEKTEYLVSSASLHIVNSKFLVSSASLRVNIWFPQPVCVSGFLSQSAHSFDTRNLKQDTQTVGHMEPKARHLDRNDTQNLRQDTQTRT